MTTLPAGTSDEKFCDGLSNNKLKDNYHNKLKDNYLPTGFLHERLLSRLFPMLHLARLPIPFQDSAAAAVHHVGVSEN